MSEPINSNPIILEKWQLPRREPVRKRDGFYGEDIRQLKEFTLSAPIHAQAAEDVPELTSDSSMIDDDSESDGLADTDPIDAQEIYDLISSVSDPEHPLTLGQLAVVSLDRIKVRDSQNPNELAEVHVEITPTITHCSLATLIGLGLRVRLERSLPPRFRVVITLTPGSHQSESQVNKQLNDKERVAAACENDQLLGVIGQMLSTCD